MENPIHITRTQLADADELRIQGKFAEAKTKLTRLLADEPDYYAALHTLGLVYLSLEDLESAFSCFSKANAVCPDQPLTLTALASVHLQRGARRAALDTIEQSLKIAPNDPRHLLTLGEVLREEREYKKSLNAFEACLAIEPGWKEACISYALVLESVGRDEDAVRVLKPFIDNNLYDKKLITLLCGNPAAYSSLDLEKLLANAPDGNAKEADLEFAWASIYEHKGEYERSFRNTIKANALVEKCISDKIVKNSGWQKSTLTYIRGSVIPTKFPENENLPTTLFILGASRSGKTTAEAVIGQTAGVTKGYENPSAINACKRAFQVGGFIPAGQYPFLPLELEQTCREFYESELNKRAGNARVFTNTSPARIHDALRMAQVLPNVKFLFIKRERFDNALRIFQKNYSSGNFYAYNLRAAFEHVDWYNTMIEHLAALLPGRARIVNYEDFVLDTSKLAHAVKDLTNIELSDVTTQKPFNDSGAAAEFKPLMKKELLAKQSVRLKGVYA